MWIATGIIGKIMKLTRRQLRKLIIEAMNPETYVDIWDWAAGENWPGSTNWDLKFPRLFRLMKHQLRWMDDKDMPEHEKGKVLYDWTLKHLDRTLLNLKTIKLYDSTATTKDPSGVMIPLSDEEKLMWARKFLKVIIDHPALEKYFVSKSNDGHRKYKLTSLENNRTGVELVKSIMMEY